MFKNKIVIIFIALVIVGATVTTFALTRQNQTTTANSTNSNSSKISVIASFYPLYDFTKNIVGDKANVTNVTPSGVDAHDFEPTSQDILAINQSELFVFLGADFDPWAQKISTNLGDKSLEITKSFELLKSDHSDEHKDEHKDEDHANEDKEKEKDKAKKETESDPHIWLDPVNAKQIVTLISQKLIQKDAANADFYTQNTNNYLQKLDQLDSDFKNQLASCEQTTFVVSHNAFSYLAKRYGLNVKSIAGLEPSDEPTVKEIAEIVDLIKKENLKTVYFENQLNSDLARTIASEAGATAVVIYSLESLTADQVAKNGNYIDLMQENLKALKQGLKCS